jgi:hypothetical protein
MIGLVVLFLFSLGLPLALLDLVDDKLGAGTVAAAFRLLARGHVSVTGIALRPTPRIAGAELNDSNGNRLAGCGAVVVEATPLAALRSLAAHALAGFLLWWRQGNSSHSSSPSSSPPALAVSVGDVFVDWTHGEDGEEERKRKGFFFRGFGFFFPAREKKQKLTPSFLFFPSLSGCLKLVSLLKSVGAVQDEAAKGLAPEPELSATRPPPRPPSRSSEEGAGGATTTTAAATATANKAALPAQPRGSSGLPKARGVLRTLEACAAGLEGTAAVAGLSVSLSPPGRLLLPELIGRALGGHLRMEVALGTRALEALWQKKEKEEGEREEEEEDEEGEENDRRWWLPSSSSKQPPRAAAFPFALSIGAARGAVSVRGWRVPTGLALERPVLAQASLGDDLARALLARVHPFLASAVSVSAAGEGGSGGAKGKERAKASAAAAAAAVLSSSSPPPAAAVLSSPLVSSSIPLPPPVRASLWPSGGHLPAGSLDIVVQPLSLSLAPTGPASSLVAALGLMATTAAAANNGGGGARLKTGKLRATVYRGGRVRAKRLDVEIAAVARKKKVQTKRKKTSETGKDKDRDRDKAAQLPRPTSAFDAAAADPLAAAQAWFSSVLSGEGGGLFPGAKKADDGKGDDESDGSGDDGGGGSGGDFEEEEEEEEEEEQAAPLRLALWGSADAGANDALDARVGIPVGALRGGGGGGGRRRKKKSKEKEKKKASGDGEVDVESAPSSSEEKEDEEDEDVVALRIVGPASNPAIDWASAARELPAAAAAAAGERVRAAAAAAVATAAASRLGSAVGAPSWLTDAASAALLRQRRPSSVGGGGGSGEKGSEANNNKNAAAAAASPAVAAAARPSLLSPFTPSSLFSSSAVPSPSPLAAPPRDEPFDWEGGGGGGGGGKGDGKSGSPLRGRRLRFGG